MTLQIVLVVNGHRWLQSGEALLERKVIQRPWSLDGLQDFVSLSVGASLGNTFEQTIIADRRWCRATPLPLDGEAARAGMTALICPHVGAHDAGAGLALEAAEAAGLAPDAAVVMVGAAMPWLPLRKKLENRAQPYFEYVLPEAGKTIVGTERVFNLADIAARTVSNADAAALFRPMESSTPTAASAGAPLEDESLAAVAIRGKVCFRGQGYGIVRRNDGRGEVSFLPGHVQAPGFEFVELGDELRFDVVRTPGGKWMAQRVVRM
jgi:cold shock CspA family protein